MRKRSVLICLMLSGLSSLIAGEAETKKGPVQEALQNRVAYKLSRSKGTLRIDDKSQKFKLGVNVEVHADDTGNLKIRATRVSAKAFTLLMTRKNVEFYLPRERKLYKGTPKEFVERFGLFSPEEILVLLLKGHPELLQTKWVSSGKTDDGEEIYESVHAAGRGYVRVVLAKKLKVLKKVEHVLGGSDEVFRRFMYDKYMSVKVDGTKKYFPRNIRVEWPRAKREITLKLRGIDDMPRITKDLWQVKLYGEVKTFPLKFMEMKSDDKLAPEK